MEDWVKVFWRLVGAAVGILAIFLAARIAVELPRTIPADQNATIDYNQILVLLLTTVTVVFAFVAVILTIFGIVGYRNLVARARRHAEDQVKKKIDAAFKDGGIGIERIDNAINDEDSEVRPWIEERIRAEVIEMMPFFVDRILNPVEDDHAMAENEPTDEGEVT